MDASHKAAMIDAIAAQVQVCTRCDLYRSRSNTVPGAGNPDADIMFVGEAPGYQEDMQGVPFVGAAGKLLDDLLAQAGIARSDIFITNILKCRPPKNRDPGQSERSACAEFLDGQIATIRPRAICLLGRIPLQALLAPDAAISRVHGQPVRRHGILWVPLFHPAAALHKPEYMPLLVQDMARLKAILDNELN